MRQLLYRILVLASLAWVPLPAGADDGQDHERARDALARGEVLPLGTVLERVSRSHPGEVMAVELEREDGRWIYELKILRPDGALGRVRADARSGEVIDMRVKRRAGGKSGDGH